jgi:hypothetical protein
MSRRATDGAALVNVGRLARRFCRQAGEPHVVPRGRPLAIPSWVIAVMIIVALLQRRKTKSAQWAFWRERPALFERLFPGRRLPARSTFFCRYRTCHHLLERALRCGGREAVRRGWADAHCVAGDKSVIAARGRHPYPKRWRKRRKRVDYGAGWSYSAHQGWVWGYAYEVVVTAPGPGGVVWPLLASADPANRHEQKSMLTKVPALPRSTRWGLFDRAYDGNALAERFEDAAPGRRFLCPEIRRSNVGKPPAKVHKCNRKRRRQAERRRRRREFFLRPAQQRRYARRLITVEPYNERVKRLFELQDRVWHWGAENNRTQLLAAHFAYQTLLHYNHRLGNHNAHLQWLFDKL